MFLDIRDKIIKLQEGYDERGLLGLAFHPNFYHNGLFYLHYSVAGTQGEGVLLFYEPNPCDLSTLNLQWNNREILYDHIDTVEEWIYLGNGESVKRKTLLNLRRPFYNHNGVNSLNFSKETGKLVLTTGDGGLAYDPFNLAQNDIEIAGKIIEIDVDNYPLINNIPAVTRFNELPLQVQECLTVIAKGVRNISGITYQSYYDRYIKYVGNVGQNLVESVYAFIDFQEIPVTNIVQNYQVNQERFINLGWRAFEGVIPSTILRNCSINTNLNEKTIAFYNEVLETAPLRINPLTCYYHEDSRPNTYSGSAITGVKVYMGSNIPLLTGCVIFSDWKRKDTNTGFLGYTRFTIDNKFNDFGKIEINSNFLSPVNYFVSLGTDINQTRIFLGVYSSTGATDYYQGSIYEIIP